MTRATNLSPISKIAMQRIAEHVLKEQDVLSQGIMRQPSGERRNQMTDANIHLMAAYSILKDLE